MMRLQDIRGDFAEAKSTIIIERLKQTENYLWLQRYVTKDSKEAHL